MKHRHTLKEVGNVAEGRYDWKIERGRGLSMQQPTCDNKQTFILVKIDYCGHDLKPVTLQHKNNYKNVLYEYKDTLGFSRGYF